MRNRYVEEVTKVIAQRNQGFLRHMNIHLLRTPTLPHPPLQGPPRKLIPTTLTTTTNVVFQRPNGLHFNNVKTLATFITKERLPQEAYSETKRGIFIDKLFELLQVERKSKRRGLEYLSRAVKEK
jgi:hypothetical protein